MDEEKKTLQMLVSDLVGVLSPVKEENIWIIAWWRERASERASERERGEREGESERERERERGKGESEGGRIKKEQQKRAKES